MRFSKNLLLTALAAFSCSTTTAYAQAIRTDVVERFDSVDAVQFVSGDWNPADGVTVWLTRALGSSVSGLDNYELEFAGPTLSASFSATDSIFQSEGQARWLSQRAAADGVRATIAASGGSADRVSVLGQASAANGFLIEVTSSYSSAAADAVVFRLSASDGETRDISFALPTSGRSLMRVHTTCPALQPGTMVRSPAEMENRCRSLQGNFYALDLAKLDRWELRLQNIPAGEHSVKVAVFPQVE